MAISSDVKHLYLRATFGLNRSLYNSNYTVKQAVQYLLDSSATFQQLSPPDRDLPTPRERRTMSQEEKMEMSKKIRTGITTLNLDWLNKMATSPAQLRERMTFFWHDHFACRHRNPKVVYIQNSTLRTHALSSFRELLHAMAKDPGMLLFLNNQQNSKTHPNENFARELLELFTLGRGYYSETDIKEAARAFTGWRVLPGGSFYFNRRQHDSGQKVFLGKSGRWGGEDIIDIVLEQRQTAQFITRKLCKYFIHEEVAEEMVTEWADKFYQSNFDISLLLTHIFTSTYFYESQHVGNRIKSPIEYMVSLMRLLDLQFVHPQGAMMLQKVLGQMLFFPPNVAGWPTGKAWIDSSTLVARLTIPQLLIDGKALQVEAKPAFAGNEELFTAQKRVKAFETRLDWENLKTWIERFPPTEIPVVLTDYLLATKPKAGLAALSAASIAQESDLKKHILRLISSPEFQLC